jgi:hypothetical protein
MIIIIVTAVEISNLTTVIRPSVIQIETQSRDTGRKPPSYKDIIMNGRPKEAENTGQTEDTPEKSRNNNMSMLTAEIARHHSEGGAQATDMTQHQEVREYINLEAEHNNDGERPGTTEGRDGTETAQQPE